MPKKIFKAIDPSFIESYFSKKKDFFFPELLNKKICKIEIKQVSPIWAKDTCLARYKLILEDGSQKIVRGSANINTSKKGVWQIMSYLYENLDNSKKLSIPQPLEHLEKINLLLYEEAPGNPLVSLLQEKNKKRKKEAMKNAALWLSWLHKLSPKKKLPKAVFLSSTDYKKSLKTIGKNIPELKKHIIFKKDISFIDNIWVFNNTIIHNDFYPGNSIIGNKKISGIDFDMSGLGPPLMDVAALFSFFDFPKRMWPYKMDKKESWDLKEVFIKEYCKKNNLDLNKTIKDIQPFLIRSFLFQLHCYVGFFLKGRRFMNEKSKNSFSMIIKDIMDKINKLIEVNN